VLKPLETWKLLGLFTVIHCALVVIVPYYAFLAFSVLGIPTLWVWENLFDKKIDSFESAMGAFDRIAVPVLAGEVALLVLITLIAYRRRGGRE
jgi:hypothetical protein